MKEPSRKDIARWLKKARRVFRIKKIGPEAASMQWDRGVDLARDIWRTMDREGFNKT